jgi:DNA-directed RNA polymerase specialized sigma subunit
MTVYEILEAPAKAMAKAAAKAREIEMLESLATSTGAGGKTIRIGGEAHLMDRVSSSRSVYDTMAEAACDAADADIELQEYIQDLERAIRKADELLAVLPARQYTVMHLIYICGKTPAEAADAIGISRSTATNDRRNAIETLEGVIAC